jgi:hypothetical protein
VRVVVGFLQAGLVHVSVAVLGAVVVGVGVLVLDVLVLVFGVRMRMNDPAVLVLVRVRSFMGVLFRHFHHLLCVKHSVLLCCNA